MVFLYSNNHDKVKARSQLWEEGSKLAGKPVYVNYENWDEEIKKVYPRGGILGDMIAEMVLPVMVDSNPACYFDKDDWALIIINTAVNMSSRMREFILYHELGHIVYAHNKVAESDDCEIEADAFAAQNTGIHPTFDEFVNNIGTDKTIKYYELMYDISEDRKKEIIDSLKNNPIISKRTQILSENKEAFAS